MAHSITVDHEVSVTSADGAPRPRASSGYSLFNNRPEPPINVNIPNLRPRAKSYSTLGAHLEPKFEFDAHTLIDENGNFRRHHGIQELIDFLKNHPPPADNFMSIPDSGNNENKGTWSKIRKLAKGKKKSGAKSPDPIRLPDSAVSGMTTGGHRHIAISIPLDASPFGRTPRSQYPVYQGRNGKAPQTRYGPTRAVLNDKGVVTVLRTVNEDQEQELTDPENLRVKSLPPLPRTTSQRSHSRSGSTHSNGRGKVSEYFGVSSSPPRSSSGPADQFKRANEASRELQNYGQSSTASNESRQEGTNPPVRGSSLVANRFVFPPTSSIDAVVSETTSTPGTLQPEKGEDSKEAGSYQGSTSKNINTSSDSDPVVSEAHQAKTPPSLEEAPVLVSRRKEENELTVITKNPLARGDGHISPTPSIASTASQSRRDRVRDKKRRDMEALRSAQNSRQAQYSEPGTPDPGKLLKEEEDEEQIEAVEQVCKSPRKSKPPPLPLKSPSRHSLCPIMVVSSIEPSPPVQHSPDKTEADKSPIATSPTSEPTPAPSPRSQIQEEVAQLGMTQIVMATSPTDIEPPLASPPLHHGFPKPPKVKPQLRHKPLPRVPSTGSSGKPGMTSPVLSFNSSNNPTPPSSIKGSPAQKSTSDRHSKQSSISIDRSSKQSTVSADRSSKQSTVSVDRSSKQSSIDVDRNSKQSPSEYANRAANRNSISKRGSWNSVRDSDRKNRDSRLGSRSLPKPLVLPKEDAEEPKITPGSERDIVRRYDVYREYRIREMERRLRRLERNGDIWLRALVPVLENLNRTLAGNGSQHGDHERAQGWVSDEDMVGSLSPPRGRSYGMGSRGRSRMMPRPGATEREFLEHLVRTKEELEAGNLSDDMSGFDTIEPLMRELAGRSRLSFEARSMALTEDDETLFRGF